MALKNRLKLKVRTFLGLVLTFVEVTWGALIEGGAFWGPIF